MCGWCTDRPVPCLLLPAQAGMAMPGPRWWLHPVLGGLGSNSVTLKVPVVPQGVA